MFLRGFLPLALKLGDRRGVRRFGFLQIFLALGEFVLCFGDLFFGGGEFGVGFGDGAGLGLGGGGGRGEEADRCGEGGEAEQ